MDQDDRVEQLAQRIDALQAKVDDLAAMLAAAIAAESETPETVG